jgi:hypothetical protein
VLGQVGERLAGLELVDHVARPRVSFFITPPNGFRGPQR